MFISGSLTLVKVSGYGCIHPLQDIALHPPLLITAFSVVQRCSFGLIGCLCLLISFHSIPKRCITLCKTAHYFYPVTSVSDSGGAADSDVMQDYMQEDPYSGHHHFSPHHEPYYNGGAGDPGYNNVSYDGQGDQYIQDDRPMKNYSDIPNGGPYSSNSNLHPDDNMMYPHHHQQQQMRLSPQPGRSQTPSDYAAPPGGGSDYGGGGGRDSYADRGGSPYNQFYHQEVQGGYSDNYPVEGYEEDPRMYRDEEGDYYNQAPPYENPPGSMDYPPLSQPPSYQYHDGVLHDDGYGQRDSYAGSQGSFQEHPHHSGNYSDHHNSGSYLDQQQQPPSRYNGGVHYPDDNYLEPVSLQDNPSFHDQPSFHQDQPSFHQDQPSYNQDQPSYHQDQPSYHQDQSSYHQDQLSYQDQPSYHQEQPDYRDDPSYHQDDPNFHQDPPSFHQDQPSYHPDDLNYHQDQPSYHQDQPSFHQDQPSFHDPSFHDPRHDSYQGSYDPHQGQYSPARFNPPDQSQYDPQGPPYDPAITEQDRYSDAPRDRHSLDQPGSGSYLGDPRPSSRLQDSSFRNDPVDYMDSPQQQGLPQVRADPFADDPFQEDRMPEDPYYRGGRGQSPAGGGSDIYCSYFYGPDPVPYDERVPPYDERDAPDPYLQSAPRYTDDRGLPYGPEEPYPEQDVSRRLEQLNLGAPPTHLRGPPSLDGRGQRIPNPDLQEVIDFLMSPDDTVKASAAAHLQHITFMDDAIKAKARSMGAIKPLLRLLTHELVEVHKNACGALQNLSYGKNNMENKREIRSENGIPELIRLLRKTDQEDVKESVTGVLWNLSSAEDLKQAIIDDGLAVLINSVILRYSGWSAMGNVSSQLPWTTVCRNTTGILRNISSAGFDARRRMRECKGLVNALIYVLKLAADDTESNAIDNKVVENIVCVLRNLSYRIQEVVDPDFYKKRSLPRQQQGKQGQGKGKGDNNAGCFGNKSSKAQAKQGNKASQQPVGMPPQLPPASVEYRSLWGSEIHSLYATVLKHCTNSITMEAAAGAIQNLTACDWQPAVESRAMVRKEKALPLLVDLLSAESDRVVCATATALRNLAIDEKNKELVGKYAIRQLVSRLPRDLRSNMPDDTICAVVATLYEVVKDNQDFALALVQEDGLPRLMHINTSEGRYLARTLKFTLTLLKTLWGFKSLQQEYTKLRYKQEDFTTSRAYPRKEGSRPPDTTRTPSSSNHTTPYNTLSRPMSGQGYDDSTLTPARGGGGGLRPAQHQGHQHQPYQQEQQRGFHLQQDLDAQHQGFQNQYLQAPSDIDGYGMMSRSNASLNNSRDRHNYSRDRIPPEEVPLHDMSSGYAPLDEPRPHRTKPPVGGVPLFPSLSPAEPSSPPYGGGGSMDHLSGPEPLYAQVNKGSRRRMDQYMDSGPRSGSPHGSLQHNLDDGGGGGADSWV
ncbi:armadillo repeat protein deleted in velo-cardio-facial syndrome-like protein [Elysia marginata]|uniref:Armadillo repeat protein deleted in velo-cardio-facial syndrome-like protein n=1 Tax=Elysia marginata TaxID=1093978 RepID=A0AAV4F4E0_9GAST|nr:armadillo repeat protein deleted in velo-cardio-facial syndrome-like protein [Elysia marginata]